MKKRFLSLLTALCLTLALAPAALAANPTMNEQNFRSAVASGGTVTMTGDVILSSSLTIGNAVTIDGTSSKYSITYSGTGSAITVTAQAAVTLKNLKINAPSGGAYAVNLTSSQPDLSIDNCEITANTRGVNMYPAGGCTNGNLTITNSTILNAQITDYENQAVIGDTRGIALFDVKGSTVEITNSAIKGFGYSINLSGTENSNGVRLAENVFNITDSAIWGWSVLNIWTIGGTFNFTNSDLRGINKATSGANSFSAIVLNKDIYGKKPVTNKPNVFNISGGSVIALATGSNDSIDETLFRVDKEYQSKFNFSLYEEDFESPYVTLLCDKPFSAFVATYDGMTADGVGTWAAGHVTGNLNTVYNWGVLAPNMNSAEWPSNTLVAETGVDSIQQGTHIGGDEA